VIKSTPDDWRVPDENGTKQGDQGIAVHEIEPDLLRWEVGRILSNQAD
jgi:hypothetical protein